MPPMMAGGSVMVAPGGPGMMQYGGQQQYMSQPYAQQAGPYQPGGQQQYMQQQQPQMQQQYAPQQQQQYTQPQQPPPPPQPQPQQQQQQQQGGEVPFYQATVQAYQPPKV